MLMFAIYLTFLFINFILFQLDPTPGHHEKETKCKQNYVTMRQATQKTLAVTSSYNFDATKLFFIYFVIYSFTTGIFKKVFCNRNFDNVGTFSPWSDGKEGFWFLFLYPCGPLFQARRTAGSIVAVTSVCVAQWCVPGCFSCRVVC